MTERRLSDSLFAVAAVWIVLSMFTFGLFVFAAVFVLPFVALALIVWGATKYFKYKAEAG